jgi:hypothetical protein
MSRMRVIADSGGWTVTVWALAMVEKIARDRGTRRRVMMESE